MRVTKAIKAEAIEIIARDIILMQNLPLSIQMNLNY